jgi:hypothetical protein
MVMFLSASRPNVEADQSPQQTIGANGTDAVSRRFPANSFRR